MRQTLRCCPDNRAADAQYPMDSLKKLPPGELNPSQPTGANLGLEPNVSVASWSKDIQAEINGVRYEDLAV